MKAMELNNDDMRRLGYKQLFRDLWRILQEYGRPTDSVPYWDGLFKAATEARANYKGSRLEHLGDRLLLTVLKHLQQMQKGGAGAD